MYELKRPSPNANAEFISFNNNVKSTFRYNGNEEDTRDVVVIPLLHLIRKLCPVGRQEIDIPVSILYANLERFRSLQRDANLLKTATEGQIEEDPMLRDRIDRLLETCANLGYPLSNKNKQVYVVFEDLDLLIDDIETENNDLLKNTRFAIQEFGRVQYMGLQDVYRIGSFVQTDAIGSLGGTLVALRIIDTYYEPKKTLFGGRKWSFRLVLETIVALGGDFVAVSFMEVFDEWEGTKDMSELIYRPFKESEKIPERLFKRGDVLNTLAGRPSYRMYRSSGFFPHFTGSSIMGGAEAARRLGGSGKIIIDTKRGLEMGHSPATATDSVGIAIAQTIKAYKTAQRSENPSDTREQRLEKMKTAGIRVFETLSHDLRSIAWPTVVGFSLTTKMWGHVVVDTLDFVRRSSDAWNQLVLPDRSKEMLMAMAASTLRGENAVSSLAETTIVDSDEDKRILERLGREPRYRFRDVVDSKGGGVLFLLYGPPGTGKTLTVEALANYFGRPLYCLSFAELGSTVAELEQRLTEVLTLAAHWGALVLLDEGDALVEKRTKGQLMLNSMTGVLLRLLESFEGALFITSNRASQFDPAALSRVTLAIKYEPLDKSGKKIIWRNMISRILAYERMPGGEVRGIENARKIVDADFDLEKLSTFDGSGRAVGALLRLAIGLADQRDCNLSQAILDDAISVWQGFRHELDVEGVSHDWKE